jgi:hypothetical protein
MTQATEESGMETYTEVETPAYDYEIYSQAADDMDDRQLLEAVYISNQVLKAQHETIINLMAETLEAVGPLMAGLGDSALMRNALGALGIKLPKPGKD